MQACVHPCRKQDDEPGRGYSAGSAGPGSGPEDRSCFPQEPWRHPLGAGHWSLAGDLWPACPPVSETALSLWPNGQGLVFKRTGLVWRLPANKKDGGQGGIRTHETVSRPHAFQACAFSRSATCPSVPAWACTLPPRPSLTGRGWEKVREYSGSNPPCKRRICCGRKAEPL